MHYVAEEWSQAITGNHDLLIIYLEFMMIPAAALL